MMDVASARADARIAKQQEKEAQKVNLPSVVSEKPSPLKFKRSAPGQIVCGVPPPPAQVGAEDPLPLTKPSMSRGSTPNPRKTSANSRDSRSGQRSGSRVPSEPEGEVDPAPKSTVDGEVGKWRRVTAERYVDTYLNGGKVI